VNREAGGGTGIAALEEFRRRLQEARGELYRTVARTDDELATLEAHQPGAPVEDAATETAARLLSRLTERECALLDEIFAAQARLEAGRYGACERCARAIPLPRLRAMPWARLCVACQSREEGRG
jgi:RNA polymerase-binding protein DksA